MASNPRPSLTRPRTEVESRLRERINLSKEFSFSGFRSLSDLTEAEEKEKRWRNFNDELLLRLFTTDEYQREYDASRILTHQTADRYFSRSLSDYEERLNESIKKQVAVLESIIERLELFDDVSSDEWITAIDAVHLLKPVFGTYEAQMTICKRAHAGLIHARAERFLVDNKPHSNLDVPKGFWWAEGHESLRQTWLTGDFDTYVERGEVRLQAFGVKFLRAEVEKMIPAKPVAEAPTIDSTQAAAKGGRPTAEWWDDLLIDVCFKHFRGDLKPNSQADVARAMQDWLSENQRDAADSTIKVRARKVWRAIQREGEN